MYTLYNRTGSVGRGYNVWATEKKKKKKTVLYPQSQSASNKQKIIWKTEDKTIFFLFQDLEITLEIKVSTDRQGGGF